MAKMMMKGMPAKGMMDEPRAAHGEFEKACRADVHGMAPTYNPPGAAPLGSGERFKALAASFGPSIKDPGALAASIGRKKYGTKRFAALSAAGRRRG